MSSQNRNQHHHDGIDKEFLKRNEFVEAVVRSKSVFETYKVPIFLLALVGLALLIGIPSYNYYRHSRAMDLSQRIFEAEKSLKKESAYKDIIRDYPGIPAVRLAHLDLADYYVSHQEPAKAHEVLDQALNGAQQDILATLTVLKKIDVLRGEKKHDKAAEFASQNEDKVLPTYKGRLKLLEAELWLSAGQSDKAKTVYDAIASAPVATEDESGKTSGYDAATIGEAKEKRLLINLGLL